MLHLGRFVYKGGVKSVISFVFQEGVNMDSLPCEQSNRDRNNDGQGSGIYGCMLPRNCTEAWLLWALIVRLARNTGGNERRLQPPLEGRCNINSISLLLCLTACAKGIDDGE